MDYNVLRRVIASCVENKGDNKYFRLNIAKLSKKFSEFGLIPLLYRNDYISKEVDTDDIFLLAEYFKDEKLNWFDGERTFLPMIFIREEDMDDNLQDLLYDIEKVRKIELEKKMESTHGIKMVDNPCKNCCCFNDSITRDMKSILISIITKYPCYFVIIANWVKENHISLNIRFRASSILINSERD